MKKIPRIPCGYLYLGKLNILLCMKLSFALVFLLSMQVSANVFSQDTRLSLRLDKVDLKEVLRAIEKKSDYRFLYKDDLFTGRQKVSVTASDEPVKDILQKVFASTGLTFKAMQNKLVVIAPAGEILKEVTVKGKVTDAANGLPLIGVTVQLKGSKVGAVTDPQGAFSLTAPDNATLVISYIGYIQQEVPVNGRTNIDIQLTVASTGLNQVVVIGYGSREKKDVTTSISSIGSEQIAQSVAMSPEFAIQGRMTGIHVSGNAANPMTRPTIRIRGVNTWGVSDPLYVVDGIPITELGAGIEGQIDARVADVRGGINIFAMLDPNDIASISVLKDASAAAIYGVRASNGVILITTKRGQAGAPSVDFSARYGVQNFAKTWDVLGTKDYVNFFKNSYAANPAVTLDPWFNPASPGYLGNSTVDEDWQTPLVNKNAPNQDYSVRVSGGSENTDYSFSLGYNNSESALINQGFERYSGSVKINTKIYKWLRTGINYRIAHIAGEDYNNSDLMDRALTPPWQPIYADGPAFLNGYAQVVKGYNPDGSWNKDKLYGEGTRINTFGSIALNTRKYKSLRNMGSVYLELEPLPNLKLKGTVSIDAYEHNRMEFGDYNSNFYDYTAGSPKDKGGGTSLGFYGERVTKNFNLVKELSLNYSRNFNGHQLDFLANVMDQQYRAGYSSGSSDYMTTLEPHLWTIDADRPYTEVQTDNFRWALEGLLGRVAYNYKSKYYLDAIVRYDGSSRFAKGNRWGVFPAMSAAWRISAEPFMKDQAWITDLKLRAGWGELGNQEVRNFAYISTVDKNPMYAFGSMPGGNGMGNYMLGAAMFSFPNPSIQWEKTATTNIGVDAVLWRGLTVTAEYYNKKTTGILQTTTLPPSVGAKNQPIANIASVRNSGMELSLGYEGKIGDFGFNAGANITTVKNEVLSTYGGVPLNNGTSRIETGYSMNYIYGYQVGGIFRDDAAAAAYDAVYNDKSAQQPHKAGDLWFRDINGPANAAKGHRFYTPGGDSAVDNFDQTYLGKTIPGYFYGFNVGLNYKGIDLSAFFQGVGDVQKLNTARQNLENTGTRGNNMSTSVLNAWSQQNPNSDMPRAVVGDPNANGRVSSRFVENAGYLRMGNLQLGYTLPASVYKATGGHLRYLRIYASASNLFLITKWKGLDPENDLQPMPRTFSIGLNSKF
ncbi:SusC/RagA family TonB-linked outer membrane protein [Chitinophaga barathri]|uniref:SusC/RagA family TonB-linked outer membrane protein n=2 Tax=Chitinophaga barathri TaxID=1647451 RepID=A0A3N4MSC0_9BACT|nr:SusC/RagA family TonB-linked outer membrane protein [Chitinophaga barathri]